MCRFEKGFILCKCEVLPSRKSGRKSNVPDTKIEYIWTLYKHLGANPEIEMGRYEFPKSDIGQGLTADFVVSQLNSRNCFDFEYSPNEGDNLLINDSRYANGRLEFLFRDEQWIVDFYDPFSELTEMVFEGKVIPETEKER